MRGGELLLVGGTAGGYPIVRACGVSDFEGKAGYYAFFFYDPDGIKLEVVHVPPRAE